MHGLDAVSAEWTVDLVAQPADEDQTICVGGPRWPWTLEDVRRIQSDPIPQSYRALFESTEPCTRWALDEGTGTVVNDSAGVQQNDMLFLSIGWNLGGGPTAASGWTGIGSIGNNGQSMFTYRRFASASER